MLNKESVLFEEEFRDELENLLEKYGVYFMAPEAEIMVTDAVTGESLFEV